MSRGLSEAFPKNKFSHLELRQFGKNKTPHLAPFVRPVAVGSSSQAGQEKPGAVSCAARSSWYDSNQQWQPGVFWSRQQKGSLARLLACSLACLRLNYLVCCLACLFVFILACWLACLFASWLACWLFACSFVCLVTVMI